MSIGELYEFIHRVAKPTCLIKEIEREFPNQEIREIYTKLYALQKEGKIRVVSDMIILYPH